MQVKQFTYNRDNTLRSVSYLNTAVSTPAVTYAYNPDYVRRTSMTDGIGTTLYSYNPITLSPALGAGQLASVAGPYANDTITYAYDQLGRRISTAINGAALAMTYDAAGRIMSETNTIGDFSYFYDGSSGRILAKLFPNGLTMTNVFGNTLQDFRLLQRQHQVGGSALSKFSYGYDQPNDRITNWSQQIGTAAPDVHSLGYDHANRLLSDLVTNSGVQVNAFAYAYDAVDNRLLEIAGGTTNVATHNALNQLSTSTAPSASRTNEWDAEDRLVAVRSGSERIELLYDGENRLAGIRQLTNSVQTSFRRFMWCDQKICQERDETGSTVSKRFYEQGMKIETGPKAGSYFYTRDHLGSVRELVDGGGVVRARYSYDPYGRSAKLSGDLDSDFGFAGMFRSVEVQLALTLFRAYDPEQGRWSSRDPIGGAEVNEGPNLYAYVGNDPLNKTDPFGLSQCCKKLYDRLVKLEAELFKKCEPGSDAQLQEEYDCELNTFKHAHEKRNQYAMQALAPDYCRNEAKESTRRKCFGEWNNIVWQAIQDYSNCRMKTCPCDKGDPYPDPNFLPDQSHIIE